MIETMQRIIGKDGKIVAIVIEDNIFRYDNEADIGLANKNLGYDILKVYPDFYEQMKDINVEVINNEYLDEKSTDDEIRNALVVDKVLEEKPSNKEEKEEGYTIVDPVVTNNTEKIKEENDKEKESLFARFKYSKPAKIIAGTLAGITLLTGMIGLGKKLKNRNVPDPVAIEEVDDESVIALREEGLKRIDEAQNYFNNIAAPSIAIPEDNGAQLYLTGDETTAVFVYDNVTKANAENFAKAFGLQEKMNEADLSKNYANAGQVLVNYYRYATEASGLSTLYLDEQDRLFFENFENKILEYNKTKSDAAKNAIQAELQEMYMSGKIDSLKDKYPGVASFIGTFMVPALYTNHVISDDLYNEIIKQNETITCNNIKLDIRNVIDIMKSSNLTEADKKILTEAFESLDAKNIKVQSREINHAARQTATTSQSRGTGKASTNSSNKANTSTTRTQITGNNGTTAREEAVKEFGETKVQQAEQKAKENFEMEYANQNAAEAEYAKGVSAGYNITYSTTQRMIFDNQTVSISNFESQIQAAINAYTGSFKDDYARGVREGATNGVNQGRIDGIMNREAAKQLRENSESKSETVVNTNPNAQIQTQNEINQVPTQNNQEYVDGIQYASDVVGTFTRG